jgi:hypothetical protein
MLPWQEQSGYNLKYLPCIPGDLLRCDHSVRFLKERDILTKR